MFVEKKKIAKKSRGIAHLFQKLLKKSLFAQIFGSWLSKIT